MSNMKSIKLPVGAISKLSPHINRFAFDMGGSLFKIVYMAPVGTMNNKSGHDGSKPEHNMPETTEEAAELHCISFENKNIQECFDFIQHTLIESKGFMKNKSINATGGGVFKYRDLITSTFGVHLNGMQEMKCLVKGCNFLLMNIPNESFMYRRHMNPEYVFQEASTDIFPYELVIIGTAVGFGKVESESVFSCMDLSNIAGGTFWGLGSLLTDTTSFDELLVQAECGDLRPVDMSRKDIGGSEYSKPGGFFIPEDAIVSKFGKAACLSKNRTPEDFKKENLVRSLLHCVCYNIGQIASIYARNHNLKKIYFGGSFIRDNELIMEYITDGVKNLVEDDTQALFLNHNGYLGAFGAMLMVEQ